MSTVEHKHHAAKVRPLWVTFLAFLVPMMGSNFLQALSGSANNFYFGHMIGVDAVAAVAGFFPIMFFLLSFIIGVGTGATVLIGQAYGAGELDRVKEVAGTVLTVTILLGLVVATFGGSFAASVLTWLQTPANIIGEATHYVRVSLLSMPLMFVFLLYTTILRGVGDARTPFYALIVTNIVGLSLTPALIRGWGGLPQLGVASGAYANLVANFVTVVLLAFYLVARRHPLAPDLVLLRHMHVNRRVLKLVLKIGLPTGVQLVFISLAEIAVLSFVNGFGSDATAAYGAVNQVASYIQFPALSIGIAASIFGAQAIGRNQQNQLGLIVRTAMYMQFAITGSLVLIGYIFARPLLGIFLTSPDVVEVGKRLLEITLWSYVVYGMAVVLSSMMRASGVVMVPVGIAIFAIMGIEVPVAWVLSKRIGLEGIWIAYPIAFAAMLAMQSVFYLLVWRKKTHKRLI